MLHPRAFALLAGLALGVGFLAACDRSPTAPVLRSARPEVNTATEMEVVANSGPGSMAALVPVAGGRIDLAARADYPLNSSLEVPAGALDGPTFFQMVQDPVTGGEYAVHVYGFLAEQLAETPLGEDPILLSLLYTAQGTQDVTVDFAPPDGSDPIVVRVTLTSGRTTTLGFRRGRSKYSVIYF